MRPRRPPSLSAKNDFFTPSEQAELKTMKIAKVEVFAIQKKPVDAKPYWGSRAWGAQEKSRA
ncbi:MAG TPA: hypothetical protein VGE93_18035, partial [Bryobacteraceae bacterium]